MSAAPSTSGAPVVVVLLGTDHHRFDRLVGWADDWALAHPDHVVLVQHGATAAPRVAIGAAFLDGDEMRAWLDRASAVVCHGGPGTVSDVRAAGCTPVVVPRDPRRGEHVDHHQQHFADWARERGLAVLARELRELDGAVDRALHENAGTACGPRTSPPEGIEGFRRMVSDTGPRPGPAVTPRAPTVLFVGGSGRSGSTLLERLLGEMPGVVPLGEVVHLWRRGIQEDQRCGCGQPFSACPFWTAVGRSAFGGWHRVDVERVLALQQQVDRQRHVRHSALRHPSHGYRQAVLAYTDHYRRIYAAAREVSGARLVVDSSKHASTALALSHDRGIDLRTLRIVRDPRGVAHSWAREVARPETAGGELMPRYSASRSTVLWLSQNLELAGIPHRRLPFTTVRYEDLVDQPACTVARAWRALGLPGDGTVPMVSQRTVDLRPSHSVAGNPMRFRTGPTELFADASWQTGLSARDRRVVELLATPLMRRFGYRDGAG